MNLPALLASAALCFVLGVGAGEHFASLRAADQAARVAKAQAAALERARVEGEAVAKGLQSDLAKSRSYQATTDERMRHAPLTTAAPRCATAGRAGPGLVRALVAAGPAAPAGGAVPAGPTVATGDGAAPSDDGLATPGTVDAGPGLTLAAVSLWNSALAGHDVPAGACRADDTSGAACTADAGLTVTDAWRNHDTNAGACIRNAQRYQSLIDYLRRTRTTR